jgi:hypothetical protein
MIHSPHIDNYNPLFIRAGYLYRVLAFVHYLAVLIYYISAISVCRIILEST